MKDTPDISFTSALHWSKAHYSSIIIVVDITDYNQVSNNRVVVINNLGFQYDTGDSGSSSDTIKNHYYRGGCQSCA